MKNDTIKTCEGSYNRDSVGFEALLEEWVNGGFLDISTKTLQVGFEPSSEFPNFDQTWVDMALLNLRSKGYEVDNLRVTVVESNF